MRVGVGVGGLVGSLSDDDQRTVVDAMYDVAGRPVPYAEQETAGHRVAGMLLDKGAETTGAAGEELGAPTLFYTFTTKPNTQPKPPQTNPTSATSRHRREMQCT